MKKENKESKLKLKENKPEYETDKEITYDENKTAENIEIILNYAPKYGSVLAVIDEENNKREGISKISPDKLNTLQSKFDCIIVDLNKTLINEKADTQAAMLLRITDYLKPGGHIFVPPSTYKYMPNDRIGTEVLLKTADLTIELPFNDLDGFIIASKI